MTMSGQSFASRVLFASCVVLISIPAFSAAGVTRSPDGLEPLAQQFVSVALKLGRVPGHEPEVDAYYGAPGARPAAAAKTSGLSEVSEEARRLVARLDEAARLNPSARAEALLKQARSLAARIDELQHPQRLTFAQEALRRVWHEHADDRCSGDAAHPPGIGITAARQR